MPECVLVNALRAIWSHVVANKSWFAIFKTYQSNVHVCIDAPMCNNLNSVVRRPTKNLNHTGREKKNTAKNAIIVHMMRVDMKVTKTIVTMFVGASVNAQFFGSQLSIHLSMKTIYANL